MNGKSLTRVNSLKILGCEIDNTLNWCNYLSMISRKCYRTPSPLYSIRKILSTSTKRLIVSATVLSKLKYAASVWFKGSKANFMAIDKKSNIFNTSVLGVFDRKALKIVWQHDQPIYSSQPPQSDGDKLYCLDNGGVLHIFEKEENE